MRLTKRQEKKFSEWLYNVFGGDEDEVVQNFYNKELRRAFLALEREKEEYHQ